MAKFLEKLFFGVRMTWLRVILAAALIGALTGGLMMIPFLDGTSFQNIGVTFEAWILLAVILCTNCEKPVEAGLKTFVFFLISQPVVYLVQWPVYHGFPWHYYYPWFLWTVATLPGGMIAWFLRKKNTLSALILWVAEAMLAGMALYFLDQMTVGGSFPRGLLSALFCLAQILVYPFVFLPRRKDRLLVWVLTLIAAIVLSFTVFFRPVTPETDYFLENASSYEVTAEDPSVVSVGIDGFLIRLRGGRAGTTRVIADGPGGERLILTVRVDENRCPEIIGDSSE